MKVIAVRILTALLLLSYGAGLTACSDVKDAVEALQLELDAPERKPIDKTRMGVNNFFVNPRVGSTSSQFSDIKNNLGLKYVRVLFAWTNEVQPSPNASPNYSFYDSIINSIPPGVDVLVVLTHTPDWMMNPANWIGGNPRATFVEKWLRPTVRRYAGKGGIVGYEVFNEPDAIIVPSDESLGLQSPELYFEMLQWASAAIQQEDPQRLVVLGATRSIQQSGSANLDYNKRLRDLGAEALVDVWAIHFYGKQYEKVVKGGGVADFLNGLQSIIWITESGEIGPNSQLPYVEEVWPFLRSEIPGIDRIYYYQYSAASNPFESFALRTEDAAFPVSDLYVHLSGG
ncbi:MAG: cellulase family glycosylhydrolase [Bdellovibrionales bacterium]|nr:cellulase family glycosylhydrolase [Bdellovibrionales bacterium]